MSKVDKYLNRAKEFYINCNFVDALNYIGQVVPSERSYDYWVLACEVNLSLNKFKEADEAISNAIHINNTESKVWYLKAKVSIGLNNYKKALRASKRALSIEENQEYRQLYDEICNELCLKREVNTNRSSQVYLFNYPNKINNMSLLTKSNSIQLLDEKRMPLNVYQNMLNYIVENPINKTSYFTGDIYHKLEEFTKCFVNLSYDSLEEEQGTYIFNTVVIDNNLNKSFKIATLIHELAHHLLSEIFEQVIMYVFDSQKTDIIEAFAYYALFYKEEYILLNEYCAHTVECHFMPYSIDNYESFNNLLNNYDLSNPSDLKKIDDAIILGNTFSFDIIYMLELFITSKLKDEIKIQYVKDGLHNTYQLGSKFKTKEKYSEDAKISLIHSILVTALINIKTTFSYSDIQRFKEYFRNANNNQQLF